MNINGKKPSNKHGVNNDYASFADIQQEDRFNKFKPIIKALILLVVIVATIFIIKPYFQNNDQSNSYETPQGVQTKTNEIAKLSQCLKNIPSSPETNDPEFYPKIISNYDSMLSCYDEYPKASSTLSRDNIVTLRQDAIDSSGTYKDTYLTNNSYNYNDSSGSHIDPTTGCDYSLSESEYIACSDKYKSTHETASSSNGQAPSSTTDVIISNEWAKERAEFDTVISCASNAYNANQIRSASGSPSYYQQKITQLKAQLTCTDGVIFELSLNKRAYYQQEITTNQNRYNDSINPDSPSYYPNSY